MESVPPQAPGLIGNLPPRVRSALSTAFLLPFVLLPYRWLWVPCALAGVVVCTSKGAHWRHILQRDGTLIVGSTLVLVLRTALDPAWWLPWPAVMILCYALQRKCAPRRYGSIALSLSTVLLAFILLDRPALQRLLPYHPGAGAGNGVLVCAGDSLTSGLAIGTDKDTYVARLRSALPCEVLNAGFASDRVSDILRRLGRDVLARRPRVVLLFIGGNDYLDGTPRSVFARQLNQTAAKISAAGARLVLVEVPTGIVWNPYAGIYRQVAARHDAILVPETRLRLWYSMELLVRGWLREPLTTDGIHLSPTGAAKVADWLEPSVRLALR